MSWTMEPFVSESLVRHLGSGVFRILGAPFEPVLRGASVLLSVLGDSLWMYRRKSSCGFRRRLVLESWGLT